MANRTVRVILDAVPTGFVAGLATARKSATEFGGELTTLGRKHSESFNKLTNAGLGLGLGLTAAFVGVVKTAADFDRQMSAVVAVSDDGAKALGKFRDAALQAGKDTAFTATEAGKAEEELAKAGVSTADILGGALQGALNLAAAGTIDLGSAATISAQAMTEFGLRGKDVGHIADVLAAGANKSVADVSGLGMALGQVGGIAHQTGLSLEDTVGVLAAFTQAGMTGAEAGTTLKQTLLKLEAPSVKSAALMKQLGINIYDAHGQFVGIDQVSQNLRDSLGGLDEAQRNAALGTIFGARAVRGATVLYKEGASGIQDWIDAVNDSGAAQRTADEKLNNLSGDMHKLIGSLQALAVSSSGGATTGLRFLAQGAEKTLNTFADLPSPISSTVTVLAGLSGAALLAGSGLAKVRKMGLDAMDALRQMGPVGGKAAGVLGAIGKWGGIAGVAAVGIFAAWEGLKAWSDWMDKKSAPVHQNIDQLTNDLRRFAQSGVAAGQMAKAFGPDLAKLAFDIGSAAATQRGLADLGPQKPVQRAGRLGAVTELDPLGAAGRKTFRQQQADIADMDAALTKMVQSGGVSQAKMAFDKITTALIAQGIPLDQINASFGQYQKASSDAALSTSALTQGFGDAESKAVALNTGLQDAIDHGQSLIDVFKELNGAALSWASATDAMQQAIADATTEIAKNGKGLDEHTQAGRNNREALLGIVDSTEKAIQARFDDTGSLEEANKVYEEGRQALIRSARQAGATQQQAQALADTWLKMPPVVSTHVQALGLDAATVRLDSFTRKLDALNGRFVNTYVVTNTVTGQQSRLVHPGAGFNALGGLYEHAAVGKLRDASFYSSMNPGRYVIAEPATGGEAFIPKRGNLARSRAIADYTVSNWLGGSTTWGGGRGGAGGGPTSIALDITLRDGEGRIIQTVRKFVNGKGGNVQFAVMGRT